MNKILFKDMVQKLHPEVYILVIPGFGIISTVISASSGKNVFGYLGILRYYLM
jgi:heme/copper-type cytochrome/quinol oxidase subunit 1